MKKQVNELIDDLMINEVDYEAVELVKRLDEYGGRSATIEECFMEIADSECDIYIDSAMDWLKDNYTTVEDVIEIFGYPGSLYKAVAIAQYHEAFELLQKYHFQAMMYYALSTIKNFYSNEVDEDDWLEIVDHLEELDYGRDYPETIDDIVEAILSKDKEVE